ncbi:hypothetical protein FR731_12165 [Enterobacter hormaechei]|uniref:hypothetical protein n=1 Tax=Enterobacter hormaechei TaxID=158836 RepID=UPI0011B988E6|nr:hypothetical protein [Enterobacter hormaechei]MBK4365864.1 hypothetical protein [Enterobacter hormaechei]MBK4592957.1 hypothetical protein [Enterobacter hormaechei]TWX79179.1 hypothetical protein FR731_12165 [Enterobacter hormaechei]
MGWIDPQGLTVYSIAKLNEYGYSGIVQTPTGGLDYSGSNVLYKKAGINLVISIEYTADYLQDSHAANIEAGLNQKRRQVVMSGTILMIRILKLTKGLCNWLNKVLIRKFRYWWR